MSDEPQAERRRRSDNDETSAEDKQYNAIKLMDSLMDKLKLLDYDTAFCTKKGFKPISRHYFALPDNPSEQLYYFSNLFAWLLSLAGVNFTPSEQFADPHTTTTNIMLELRKQMIPADYSQTKLKQGHGEEVCSILDNAAQIALTKLKWTWKKPNHVEPAAADMNASVMEEEMEVTAANTAVDEVEEVVDEEDEDFISAEKGLDVSVAPQDRPEATEPTINIAEWSLEVERVLPQLKVIVRADERDWRSRIEELIKHEGEVRSTFSDTKTKLDKMHSDITRGLEKIASREKYLNAKLEGPLEDFRVRQDALSSARQRYNSASGNVNELSKELAKLTNQLETLKHQIQEQETSLTDQAPLIKIKKSLKKLKAEITQMDMRIGVAMHTLLAWDTSSRASMFKEDELDHDENSFARNMPVAYGF